MDLTELKSVGKALSGGYEGEYISLPSLPSRGHLHSLIHGIVTLTFKVSNFGLSFPCCHLYDSLLCLPLPLLSIFVITLGPPR